MNIKPEDRILIFALKLQLSKAEMQVMNELLLQVSDWDVLCKNAVDLGIGPLLSQKLAFLSNASVIPPKVQATLQQSYYITLSRSMVMVSAFQNIIALFIAQGITPIVLKGMYLSEWLYEDIGLRQMSDIDLLVKEEDAQLCLQLLSEMGYVPEDVLDSELEKKLEVVHFPPMVLNGISVELHIKLHFTIERYQLDVDRMFDHAMLAKVHQQDCLVMDVHDLLIYVLIHLDKHFQNGHVQFTSFSDVVNIVVSKKAEINWKIVEERCDLYNCKKEVFSYLVLLQSFIEIGLPEELVLKYKRFHKKSTTTLFLNYLNGYVGFTSGVPKHLSNFAHLKSMPDILRYIVTIIFPSREFMKSKFKLDNYRWLYLYYIYRWFIGIKGLFNLFRK